MFCNPEEIYCTGYLGCGTKLDIPTMVYTRSELDEKTEQIMSFHFTMEANKG